MKLSAAFQNFTDVQLALAGFAVFGAVFVGALIWVFFIQSEKHFNRMSEMPLNDEVKSS